MNLLLLCVCLVISYLLGACPNGLLIARVRGVDIRQVGSGNIGATNVFRSVGKGAGMSVFLLDALKGFIPAFCLPLLVGAATGEPVARETGIWFGVAAIAGHNWPVYLRFKGGKGVATSAGVLIGVAPAAVGIGLVAWLGLFLTTRYVSVGSIGAAVAVAITGWVRYRDAGLVLPIVLTLLAALVVWRHRTNLQRLADGTENRFEFRKQQHKNDVGPGPDGPDKPRGKGTT